MHEEAIILFNSGKFNDALDYLRDRMTTTRQSYDQDHQAPENG